MRREGSPWQGLGTVYAKELADHISSARMLVIQILFLLIACVVVYFAIDQIRQTTAEDPFVLLKLFTAGRSSLLSLLAILRYSLTERRCLEIKALLAERHARAAESPGQGALTTSV